MAAPAAARRRRLRRWFRRRSHRGILSAPLVSTQTRAVLAMRNCLTIARQSAQITRNS